MIAVKKTSEPRKRGRAKKIEPAAKKISEKEKVVTHKPKLHEAEPTKEAVVEKVATPIEPEKPAHYFYAIGRRKSAMAKIRLHLKAGDVKVNNKDYKNYFQGKDQQKIVLAPLALLGLEKTVSVEVFPSGGGIHAQAEAVRHGISRALIARNLEDKSVLKKAGFLTRDPRVKERKKPGHKRARRSPQWSKR